MRQLHYTGWPDHGVPSGDSMTSFQLMLEHFIMMLLTSGQNEKVVVHCSAGIGRTGTTISLAHNIVHLWAQRNAGLIPKLSIFSTVRRLREQRLGMVQVTEQYHFIYAFLRKYMQLHKFV